MSAGKGKKANAIEGEQVATITILKKLRDEYTTNSKHFLTEPTHMKRFDKAVQSCEHIDKIILNNINVTFNEMYALTTTLREYEQLNFLCLWMVQVDLRCMESLAKFCAVHPTLSTLHLIDCGITSDMTPCLSSICRESKSLKNLVLDHNHFGSKGAGNVFTGVRFNSNPGALQKLSLRYCEIDSQLDYLNYMLCENTSLTDLDLTGNCIGDSGLIPISQALKQNSTLTNLSIAANGISEQQVFTIFNTAAAGTTTTTNHNNNNNNNNSGNNSLSTGINHNYNSSSNGSVNSIIDGGSDQDQQQQQKLKPGMAVLCETLGLVNLGLSVLDMRGNHLGKVGCKAIYTMMSTRKSTMASRKASPLVVHVTERIPGELFEKILDLNDAMNEKRGGKRR